MNKEIIEATKKHVNNIKYLFNLGGDRFLIGWHIGNDLEGIKIPHEVLLVDIYPLEIVTYDEIFTEANPKKEYVYVEFVDGGKKECEMLTMFEARKLIENVSKDKNLNTHIIEIYRKGKIIGTVKKFD